MAINNINKNLVTELDKDIEGCEKVIKNEQDTIKKYEGEITYLRDKIINLRRDLNRKIRARALYLGVELPPESKSKKYVYPKKKKEEKESEIEVTVVDEEKMVSKEEVQDENES